MPQSIPTVSVIIPAYHAADVIETALRSLQMQTHTAWEAIVVDDGSADATSATVEGIVDERIRLVRHEVNRGVSQARNAGIEAARGQWIALLDADDVFHPQRLSRLLHLAEATMATMIADNQWMLHPDRVYDVQRERMIDRNGFWATIPRLLGPTFPSLHRLTLVKLLYQEGPDDRHYPFGLLKPMIRRDFLRTHALTFDPDQWMSEDQLFFADCLGHGAAFVITATPMYGYQRGGKGVTAQAKALAVHAQRMRLGRLLLERPYIRHDPDDSTRQAARSFLIAKVSEFRRHIRDAEWDARSSTERAQLLWRDPSFLTEISGGKVRQTLRRLRRLPRRLTEELGLVEPAAPERVDTCGTWLKICDSERSNVKAPDPC